MNVHPAVFPPPLNKPPERHRSVAVSCLYSFATVAAQALLLAFDYAQDRPKFGSYLAYGEHVDSRLVLSIHLQHGVETVVQKGAHSAGAHPHGSRRQVYVLAQVARL